MSTRQFSIISVQMRKKGTVSVAEEVHTFRDEDGNYTEKTAISPMEQSQHLWMVLHLTTGPIAK